MADKKRILFIVEAMGGGVFTYIVNLANELVDIYDMYIAYAVREQTPPDYKEYFDKRIHLIEVKNFKRSINPIKDIKAFIEIKSIVKKIKPDVIHLHSSKAGALGRFAFNGKDVPLFYTPHGYSFLMQNSSPAKRMVYKAVETVCGMKNCMTISCGKGEHQETLKLTKNAAYVNNGINMDELKKLIDSTAIVADHPFTVFTLGRICYQKNPVLFNQIALAMPEVKFLWIGDGELRNELTAKNIEITGWCKREDALKHSLEADVFLLTSLWEGLPISLLESMYMKKLYLSVVNSKQYRLGTNIEKFIEVIKIFDFKKMSDFAKYYLANKKVVKISNVWNESPQYIDGNIQVVSDVSCLYTAARYSTSGIAMHRHRTRDCAYLEAKACILSGKGNKEAIIKQMEKYETEGFPHNFGLCEASIIVVDFETPNSNFIFDG